MSSINSPFHQSHTNDDFDYEDLDDYYAHQEKNQDDSDDGVNNSGKLENNRRS